MGLVQLTAFKALHYRNCSLRPRGQRKGWHKRISNNVGDKKAPLGSGWFFIIPQQLRQVHFPAVREPFLCSLTSSVPQVNWGMSELAAASFGEPGCVSHNGNNLQTLSWRRLPVSCPPAGRGGLAVGTIPLHSRGQMLFTALLSGRVPSFIWRVPKCSFSVADPLKPQGSHIYLLPWQPC